MSDSLCGVACPGAALIEENVRCDVGYPLR